MIQPYSSSYLEQYFKEFTDEIVKYQYPDSFCDMNKADEVMLQIWNREKCLNWLSSHMMVSFWEAWKHLILLEKRLNWGFG